MKSFLRSKTPQPPESISNIAATPSPIPPQSSSDNVAPTTSNVPPENREAMASQPKPTRKRDKVKEFFRNSKTRQPPESTSNIVAATQPPPGPIPPQSSSDNVASTAPNAPTVPPPPIAQQKAFVKTKVLEKDIAVLSITYILADNPELKRLIHLIVEIHDKDEEGQVILSIDYAYQYI
jgi:hypothetical protein